MKADITELLKRHPASVLLWLEEWLRNGNTISYESDIHWQRLGDSATAKASNQYEQHTVLERILWGSIAVTVREHLANSESNSPGALWRAMIVRHNLIMLFGNHPGDPLCDSRIIRDWFFQWLPMSLEQARIEAGSWHTKPDDRTLELKWLIDQLESLRFLVTAKRLEADVELQPWLEILNTIRPVDRGPN